MRTGFDALTRQSSSNKIENNSWTGVALCCDDALVVERFNLSVKQERMRLKIYGNVTAARVGLVA